MQLSTKIWLLHSALGLASSLLLVFLFESFPSVRILSNEAVVFGVMSGAMGMAINRAMRSSLPAKTEH